MFWITLGIGTALGLAMAIIICALVMDKFLPLGNKKHKTKVVEV